MKNRREKWAQIKIEEKEKTAALSQTRDLRQFSGILFSSTSRPN